MPPPAPKAFHARLALAALVFFGLVSFYQSHAQVPILMYHHVGNVGDHSSLNVETQMFQRQMEFLKIHRYNVMSFADFLDFIKQDKHLPPRTVLITFDDGHLDNIENAFPILKKMHFPAAIFMITDNINKKGWLGEEDLKILDQSGITIGSHTVHHAYLPDLQPDEMILELRESRRRLESILGHPVTYLSYPAGGFNEVVRSVAEKEGYVGAFTTNHGKGKMDAFSLRRIKITRGKGGLFNFWLKLSGVYHVGKKSIPIN